MKKCTKSNFTVKNYKVLSTFYLQITWPLAWTGISVNDKNYMYMWRNPKLLSHATLKLTKSPLNILFTKNRASRLDWN